MTSAIPARVDTVRSDAMLRMGYRHSSDDLLSGLDISSLRMTALPVEVVSELLRLRKTWGDNRLLPN